MKLKIGVVGLGQRGATLMRTILHIPEAQIVAVCDCYQDRVDKAISVVSEKYEAPKGFLQFDEFLQNGGFDALVISASWDVHVKMAVESMKAGKITAMEVGGAHSVEECWELVRAYEETKTPFMFLENCCYDRFELLSTSLVRRGMLGEIVHCKGAYGHDLRDEILGGKVNRHYRLEQYKNFNCENYPTHELGPIAKILDITRGNKMNTLVSVASKGVGLEAFATNDKNPDKDQIGVKFKQGDIVNTIITCENGETILLTLDTTLPRYYTRDFTVRGTKGFTNGEVNMVFLEDKISSHEFFETEKTVEKYLNNAEEYKEYLPSYWRNITQEEKDLGHGGMDYYMLKEFTLNALNGNKMPIDVYDAASWMVITALSGESIANNGKIMEIPDFTNGKWKERKSEDVVEL